MSEKSSGIFGFLARKALERAEQRLTRHKTTQNVSNTGTALVLMDYSADYQTRLHSLPAFFQQHQINYTLVLFLSKKDEIASFMPKPELFPISKKDCNFIGIPSGHEIQDLLARRPDILIEFDSNPSFPLEWISRLSHSSFKIGRGEHKPWLDFIIQDSGNQDKIFTTQLTHWLQSIQLKK